VARDEALNDLVGVDRIAGSERDLESADVAIESKRGLVIVVLTEACRGGEAGEDRGVVAHPVHDDAVAVAAPGPRLRITVADVAPAQLQQLSVLTQEKAGSVEQ